MSQKVSGKCQVLTAMWGEHDLASQDKVFLYISDIYPGGGMSEAPGDKSDEDNRNIITVTIKSKHLLSVVGSVGKPVTNTVILLQG